jgi:hypothetical protein
VTRDPSARSNVNARTCVDKTPKLMPEPCVAVVTIPASVRSETEGTLISARP